MHLIFCVDDRDGLSFCGRRLSRDREVTAHMLRLTADSSLLVHPYSASLFPEGSVVVDEEYLSKAGKDDFCFVEKGSVPESAESVTLYLWNRAYPSTERFPRELLDSMKLAFTEEFSGFSHEKITMERYIP